MSGWSPGTFDSDVWGASEQPPAAVVLTGDERDGRGEPEYDLPIWARQQRLVRHSLRLRVDLIFAFVASWQSLFAYSNALCVLRKGLLAGLEGASLDVVHPVFLFVPQGAKSRAASDARQWSTIRGVRGVD